MATVPVESECNRCLFLIDLKRTGQEDETSKRSSACSSEVSLGAFLWCSGVE